MSDANELLATCQLKHGNHTNELTTFEELDAECKAGNSPIEYERATLAKLDRMVCGDGAATAPAMIDRASSWTADRKRIAELKANLKRITLARKDDAREIERLRKIETAARQVVDGEVSIVVLEHTLDAQGGGVLGCPPDLVEHAKADYHQTYEDCPVAVRRRDAPPSGVQGVRVKCPVCKGRGLILEYTPGVDICPSCDGEKTVLRDAQGGE